MREAMKPRPEAALDDVSANLAEVLKRADVLLAEWSAFGASVKVQVDREAGTIGHAVASSVDGAVSRAVAAGVDRAVPEQLTARMAALTAEITKLEHRARTAARAISDERVHDRRLLGVIVLGVLAANALLLTLLLREPRVAVRPRPEATRVELAPDRGQPAATNAREIPAAGAKAAPPPPSAGAGAVSGAGAGSNAGAGSGAGAGSAASSGVDMPSGAPAGSASSPAPGARPLTGPTSKRLPPRKR